MKLACSLISVIIFFVIVVGAPFLEIQRDNWPGAGYEYATDFEAVRSGQVARNIQQLLDDRSQLDDLLRPRYQESLYVATGLTTPGVVVGPNDWLFPASRLRGPEQAKLDALHDTCAAVAGVADWFEAQGCVAIFELVPRKQTLYPEELPSDLHFAYKSYFEQVRDALLKQGLWVPDLRLILRPEDGLYYLPNDDHWNCDGCYAAAEYLAGLLKERFGEEGIPGRSIALLSKRMEPTPFIGTPQRMLGFSEHRWLFKRFTRPHERITSVRVGNEQQEYMGSFSPQPVLMVGTSFSASPFRSPSHYSALLGVEVENHAYGGFAAGYRMAEVARAIMTGRREAPRLLIWEFPEDFPLLEDQYFREPLEAILDAAKHAPYTAGPIEASERLLEGIVVQNEESGMLAGTSSGSSASITYSLTAALSGNGQEVLSFDFNCLGKGAVLGELVVEWGAAKDARMPNRKVILMQRSSRVHPVLVRLTTHDGAPIRHIRIRPHTLPTRIELGNVEIWTK